MGDFIVKHFSSVFVFCERSFHWNSDFLGCDTIVTLCNLKGKQLLVLTSPLITVVSPDGPPAALWLFCAGCASLFIVIVNKPYIVIYDSKVSINHFKHCYTRFVILSFPEKEKCRLNNEMPWEEVINNRDTLFKHTPSLDIT